MAGDQSEQAGNGNGGKPAKRGPGKTPLIILAIVVIVAIIVAAWYFISTRNIETTDDAQTDGNVVTIAPKISGYVVNLAVGDNQRVKAGDLLMKIDPRDYLIARDQARASLLLAEAQRDNAKAALDISKISTPARLAQAQAQRDAANANRELALADLNRQTSVDKRATTQQSIDQAATQVKQASATLANNDAAVKIASAVSDTIAQAEAAFNIAKAQVAQAQAQLENAELNLSYTEIHAPQDGWITRRNVQLGSYVQAGQAGLSLVTSDVWVTANFKENQLDRMRPGQKVTILVDAYGSLVLHGHVDSVQMGTGSRFSAFPAENATGNFVKIVQRVPVKILIDSGLDPQLPLPLGLSVDPTVELE
jgi:membrane fusion protein (multidrug efflux system)